MKKKSVISFKSLGAIYVKTKALPLRIESFGGHIYLRSANFMIECGSLHNALCLASAMEFNSSTIVEGPNFDCRITFNKKEK